MRIGTGRRVDALAADSEGRLKRECEMFVAAYMADVLAAIIHAFHTVKHHGSIIIWIWAICWLEGVPAIG